MTRYDGYPTAGVDARTPRPTQILTHTFNGRVQEKLIDMAKAGDRKWLLSHLNWALKNRYEVTAKAIES